jgi:hypothetical protein
VKLTGGNGTAPKILEEMYMNRWTKVLSTSVATIAVATLTLSASASQLAT